MEKETEFRPRLDLADVVFAVSSQILNQMKATVSKRTRVAVVLAAVVSLAVAVSVAAVSVAAVVAKAVADGWVVLVAN